MHLAELRTWILKEIRRQGERGEKKENEKVAPLMSRKCDGESGEKLLRPFLLKLLVASSLLMLSFLNLA